MTANELADEVMEHYKAEAPRGFNVNWMKEVATMLRQQAQEIEALKKELALQRLSDFSQEIEDRESAIYATGYWKGVEYKRMRELTDAEIMEIYDRVELYNIDEGQMYLKPIEFAKELLKKASSEK